MKSLSDSRSIAAFATLLLLLGASISVLSAQEAPRDLAKPSFGPNYIVWDPQVKDGLSLTISGGRTNTGAQALFCQSFKPGERLVFKEEFPDGVYKWEVAVAASVTAKPESDGSNGRDLERPRPPQKPKTVKVLLRSAGPIQAGSFTIFRGRIIDPASGKEEQQSNK